MKKKILASIAALAIACGAMVSAIPVSAAPTAAPDATAFGVQGFTMDNANWDWQSTGTYFDADGTVEFTFNFADLVEAGGYTADVGQAGVQFYVDYEGKEDDWIYAYIEYTVTCDVWATEDRAEYFYAEWDGERFNGNITFEIAGWGESWDSLTQLGDITVTATVSEIELGGSDVELSDSNFGDETFLEYVKQFDTDGDGYLSKEERDAVTEIDLSDTDLEYINGLWFFNNIEKLDVSNTAITELYVSNMGLKELDVTGCDKLETLYCSYNDLTKLDVSTNTALVELSCYYNELTELDLSANTALEYLDCEDNGLTKLDVSKNTALEALYCGWNALTELDVSANTALEFLSCGYNKLAKLDVSKNTKLYGLTCYDNELTELIVNGAENLRWLYCEGNKLTELDISGNPNLINAYTLDEEPEEIEYDDYTAIYYYFNGTEAAEWEDWGELRIDETVTILTEAKPVVNDKEEEKDPDDKKDNKDDKKNDTPKTGSSAGLAFAGLALAGLAVVATKKDK